MNKTFTQNLHNCFKKALLVIALACSTILVHASAELVNIGSNGIQVKVVKCYPNPAVSFTNFDINTDYVSKNYTLEVYSFTGKKMYETKVNNTRVTLTFSNDFYRGIYVYQLHDNNGKLIETGKFQVNK